MSLPPEEVGARARHVRLLLLDVDGVLTDGTVSVHSTSGESKRFFIRDGAGIVWARRAGLEIGFLSGRKSAATSHRAAELGVQLVWQGGTDKLAGYEEIVAARGYKNENIAYMADDILDLPVLSRVGLSGAPLDAVEDVRARVHWVSQFPGGRGAVREFLELILKARGKWDGIVRAFLA